MKALLRFLVVVTVFLAFGASTIEGPLKAVNPLRLQWLVVNPYASGSFDGGNLGGIILV